MFEETPKHVLVCGSEGSLMQSVIHKLLLAGHKVTGVDSLLRHGERNDHYGIQNRYDFIHQDLTKYDGTVAKLFSHNVINVDAIIQGAALIYGVGGFNKYRADILSNDLILNANVLRIAKDVYSKSLSNFVYISSSMVYETVVPTFGRRIDVEEMDPDYFPPPQTDYGLSKYTGERLVHAYHAQYDIPYTVWRPFNIITPYESADDQEQGISHVFADFIDQIVKKNNYNLDVLGDGKQIRCFSWIEDIATGIADNLFNSEAYNDTFNIGNKEPYSMIELADLILEIKKEIVPYVLHDIEMTFNHKTAYPNDVRIRIPNIEKIYKKLNWTPTTTTIDSVRNCVKYALYPKEYIGV